MGKKAFYLDMLRKYVENQGEAPEKIRQSLEAGDRGTAERLAHTAKGVSGNIGATRLQELAAEVEKAIREGLDGEEIEARMAPFAAAHGEFVSRLREAMPRRADREENGENDEAKIAEVCKKMAILLENDDSEAVDLLEAEAVTLRSALGTAQYGPFENAVKQYDFGEALKLFKSGLK
jgi:HPt (histidine-containing phosphotransfer) domain-containing protein